jgi:hypothetical protein
MELVQCLKSMKMFETRFYLLLMYFVNGTVYCGSLAVVRTFRHRSSVIFFLINLVL